MIEKKLNRISNYTLFAIEIEKKFEISWIKFEKYLKFNWKYVCVDWFELKM